jgi:hypothetical protein
VEFGLDQRVELDAKMWGYGGQGSRSVAVVQLFQSTPFSAGSEANTTSAQVFSRLECVFSALNNDVDTSFE